MATVTLKQVAPFVYQKSVTIIGGAWVATDTVTLSIDGVSVLVITATQAMTATEMAAALVAAVNGSSVTSLAEERNTDGSRSGLLAQMTAYSAAGVVTLEGKTERPFTPVINKTGAGGTVSAFTELETASGPTHLIDANCDGGALPGYGDSFIIDKLTHPLKFQLDVLDGLSFALFSCKASAEGEIGLPPINNEFGIPFSETLGRQLRLGACSKAIIGEGTGQGIRRLPVHFGGSLTPVDVIKTGNSADSNIAAVQLDGLFGASILRQVSGSVEFASNEPLSMGSVHISGGTCLITRNVSMTDVQINESANVALSGVVSGTVTINSAQSRLAISDASINILEAPRGNITITGPAAFNNIYLGAAKFDALGTASFFSVYALEFTAPDFVYLDSNAYGSYYGPVLFDRVGLSEGQVDFGKGRALTIGVVDTPPPAPIGVAAAPGDTEVQLSWSSVPGALLYNVYWSTSAGVTPQTGTKIPNATSPYVHTGRTNGIAYYYVVTAENSIGESVASEEVSAVPVSEAIDYYLRSLTIAKGSLSDLTGYQVPVLLTAANMSFAKSTSDGHDVRVWTDASRTTPVPFSIESWDQAGESALLWVKPPTNDADLFLEYGNPEYTVTESDPATVFEDYTDLDTSENKWTGIGSDSLWSGAYCPDNDRIYYFGNDNGGGTGQPHTQWYDATTGETGFGELLSTPVTQAGVIWNPTTKRFHIYGGSACVGGAQQNKIQWYDPATDTSGVFTETLPTALDINGVGYYPAEGSFFYFGGYSVGGGGYQTSIVRHRPGIDCAATGAVMPSGMSGVGVVWKTSTSRFILLGGGQSTGPGGTNAILTYNPATPASNPVSTGHTLPYNVMDLACVITAAEVVYGFCGHDATAGYRDGVIKYLGTGNATLLAATVAEAADDIVAAIRPDGNVVVGPVNHSTQPGTNDAEYQLVMYVFDTTGETLTAEPAFPGPPAGIVDCGTNPSPWGLTHQLGTSKIVQRDYSSSLHTGAYWDFGATRIGKFTLEAWVELSHKDKTFSLKVSSTANTSQTTDSIGALRTNSGNWNHYVTSDNVVGAIPTRMQHIVGMHFDTGAAQMVCSIQRGGVSAARSFRNSVAAQRLIFHTAGTNTQVAWMIDRLQVRKWVGVGGTEPTVTVGAEVPAA